MALAIKPEHTPAWEWAAAKVDLTVEALAQTHLDIEGGRYMTQMRDADKTEYAGLFDAVLQLTPERRVELQTKALELLTEQGLPVPQE